MYSSLSLSKCFILVHVMAIQLLLISSVLSLNMTNAYLKHKCLVNQGKFKPGSKEEKEMKNFIISIYPTSSNKGGFEILSIGAVSVVLQCRGDSYGTKCRDCLGTAVAGLRRRCPSYKGAIIWYDQCLLAISSIESIGMIDYKNNFCMSNSNNVDGDLVAFELSRSSLILNLTSKAINVQNISDPGALYAVGESWFKKTKLYGMVQCPKDMSPRSCEECVNFNMLHFQDCLKSKRGGRVIGRSCSFRFEFYPFATETDPKYLKI